MYLYHFGLNELPFTLTPNTQFYVDLQSHKDALEVLTTALKAGEGFIKVTGEVGTGKTLICRKLLNELPESFVTAYIPNPYLSPDELRIALAEELGIKLKRTLDQHHITQLIQKKLVELAEKQLAAILIIDEAQALPKESLEALRLFTNLETERRKLLQVVLFGQPELDQVLEDPKIRQLKQRITFSYQLRKLTAEEIKDYIATRLYRAGANNRAVFENGAMKLVARYSRGIPRLVNILCHKGLMLAYGKGAHKVGTKDMLAAVRDTEDTKMPLKKQQTVQLMAIATVLSLGVALWFWRTAL